MKEFMGEGATVAFESEKPGHVPFVVGLFHLTVFTTAKHDSTIQAIQEAFGSDPFYRLAHGVWVVSANVRESELLKRIQEKVREPVFICSGTPHMGPNPDFQKWLASKKLVSLSMV